MRRNQLLDLLSEYLERFPEEEKVVSRVETFVRENSACFERSLTSGHITGSSWIVDLNRSHALFSHHKKLNMWLQLGGHADGDPDVFRVALKEAEEESGLKRIMPLSHQIFDIDVHLVPDGGSGHYHYDIRFIFEADRQEKLVVSDESHSLAWTELDTIEEVVTEPSILRMYSKAKGII